MNVRIKNLNFIKSGDEDSFEPKNNITGVMWLFVNQTTRVLDMKTYFAWDGHGLCQLAQYN